MKVPSQPPSIPSQLGFVVGNEGTETLMKNWKGHRRYLIWFYCLLCGKLKATWKWELMKADKGLRSKQQWACTWDFSQSFLPSPGSLVCLYLALLSEVSVLMMGGSRLFIWSLMQQTDPFKPLGLFWYWGVASGSTVPLLFPSLWSSFLMATVSSGSSGRGDVVALMGL